VAIPRKSGVRGPEEIGSEQFARQYKKKDFSFSSEAFFEEILQDKSRPFLKFLTRIIFRRGLK